MHTRLITEAMTLTQAEVEKAKRTVDRPAPLASSPRKRRRRAPAAGAADDCFACQDRQTKCDRRRPYCTPCLDLGKDCSGYKTTLTWGVGVASRGKLRGLSLPIASSRKAVQGDDIDDKPITAPRKLAKLSSTRSRVGSFSSVGSISSGLHSPPAPTSTNPSPTTYDFVNCMDPTSQSATTASPMLPPPSFDFRMTPSPSNGSLNNQRRLSHSQYRKQRRHTLQPLSVPTSHPSRDYGVAPMTASIVGGYGNHNNNAQGLASQISPMVPTFTGYGLVSPPHNQFAQFTQQPMHTGSPAEGNFYPSPESMGWAQDDLNSSVCSDTHSSNGFAEDIFGMDSLLPSAQSYSTTIVPTIREPDSNSLMMDTKFADFSHSQTLASQPLVLCTDDVGDHVSPSVPRSLQTLSIGNTLKLQYLIDYYDKVISPVIVAFDGPNNPYRSHILSLAVHSETLQHAIAALACGNIRMRRTHNPLATNRSHSATRDSSHDQRVRRSSFAHNIMDLGLERLPQTSNNEPSGDELYYKSASIKALNEQLSDPHRRKDDSILATLLILCLYHICDTGIAKFKTQFAGVKKILALRGGTQGSNSKASNWLTIMFTWFDAMTATVNDREGQFSGDDIDMSKLNADEWALENLAGCDGRLFKIIAKLGRLNLLSQNKPVAEVSPKSSPMIHSASAVKSQDFYSMNYNGFDGNGWSEMPSNETLDARAQFWREWTDIRGKLLEWSLDECTRLPVESTHPEQDRQDLYHISESFRYSALLYTERLGYPHLSSAHPKFQNLVTHALYHISNVKSDVFLLWPLFITGTECVSEQGRFIIRERCLDIQKDSGFFNNISGLELLEKVWRDDYQEKGTSEDVMTMPATGMGPGDFSTLANGGFKWRKAMERIDGEYIVV